MSTTIIHVPAHFTANADNALVGPEVPFPYERPTDRGCEPYSVIYQHHHARESEREQTYAAWPSVQQTAPPVPVNNSEEERGVAPQDDETAQAGEPSAPGSRLYFLSGPVGVDPDQWSDRGVDLDQHERSVITPFDHVELGDWAEKWLYDQVYLHPSEHMWAEIQGTPVQFPHAGAWRVELSNDARNWSLLVNQEMVDRCNGHYIGDYHGIVMLKVERPPGTVHIQLLTAFHRCAQRNPYASRELKILWRDVKRWWNMCQDLDYNFTIEEYFNALTAS